MKSLLDQRVLVVLWCEMGFDSILDALNDRMATDLDLRDDTKLVSLKTVNPFKLDVSTPSIVDDEMVPFFVFFLYLKFA